MPLGPLREPPTGCGYRRRMGTPSVDRDDAAPKRPDGVQTLRRVEPPLGGTARAALSADPDVGPDVDGGGDLAEDTAEDHGTRSMLLPIRAGDHALLLRLEPRRGGATGGGGRTGTGWASRYSLMWAHRAVPPAPALTLRSWG